MSRHHVFMRHRARDGSQLALTLEECVLLDKVRDEVPFIPRDKYFMVEKALERLGRISMEQRAARE